MTIVLILNVLLAGVVCFAVVGGLVRSIAAESSCVLHRGSRHVDVRPGGAATPLPAEVTA
jgi:hypothetical protein